MNATGETRDRFQGIARSTVTAAVVLSPWLFGSADPWAYLVVCVLVGLGVGAWLFSVVCDPRPRVRAPLLTAALGAILTFLLFQMTPLPLEAVRELSPASAEVTQSRVELFELVGVAEFLPAGMEEDATSAVISESAAATRRSFYLIAAYVGVLLVAANTFTKWKQLRRAAGAIVISSFAIAVLGMIHKFSGNREIFWFHEPRFGGEIFGPFTNPNHYAAYMNLALGVSLGLLLAGMATSRYREAGTVREKLVWLSSGNAGSLALIAFAAVVMTASVCMSLSRGGITSLAAALGMIGAYAAVRGERGHVAHAVAGVALVSVAGVIWLGWEPVVRELGSLSEIDVAGDYRTETALATLRIFGTAPLFGCGFGSFQHVFPAFQGPNIQIGRWLHAHNEYIQLVAEGGAVGAILVVLAGLAFARSVQRGFRRTTRVSRLFVGGIAVGLAAIAVHSLVDYSLHKPANAFLLAALCGMCVAAVHIRGTRVKETVSGSTDHDGNGRWQKRRRLGVVQG